MSMEKTSKDSLINNCYKNNQKWYFVVTAITEDDIKSKRTRFETLAWSLDDCTRRLFAVARVRYEFANKSKDAGRHGAFGPQCPVRVHQLPE